jgi:hypothetical protein
MTLPPGAFEAVRALIGGAPQALHERDGLVAGAGAEWQVTAVSGDGLTVNVLIVAPLATIDASTATWLADLPGRGFVPLDGDAEALAALFAACPNLSSDMIARIAAVNLDTSSADRVLMSDDEIDSLLAERAADVPRSMRELEFGRTADGGWVLSFLGARLARRPPDNCFRLTVSRWRVTCSSNARLRWERNEILSDVLLARYAQQ